MFFRILFSLIFIFLYFFSFLSLPAFSNNNYVNHSNVLMYHRFGENNYPSTNIKMSQFQEHISELKKSPYNIISLNKAIKAIKNEIKIPDHSVVITIDDT